MLEFACFGSDQLNPVRKFPTDVGHQYRIFSILGNMKRELFARVVAGTPRLRICACINNGYFSGRFIYSVNIQISGCSGPGVLPSQVYPHPAAFPEFHGVGYVTLAKIDEVGSTTEWVIGRGRAVLKP